jgi:hypothetical protein
LVTPLIVSAHVVSMSYGELRITGRTGAFELRIPAYEIEHVANPEMALLDEFHFAGATRTAQECANQNDDYICHATYTFDRVVGNALDAQCTLYRVTVPNHIHMLYAAQGENGDQKVFDQNTTQAELRFHAPSLWESITRDGAAGALRFLQSAGGLIFLPIVALSARTGREALGIGTAFLTAEWIVRPLTPYIPIGLSREFLEALMALTAAYLAGEILFLPESNARRYIVPALGLIHGLPFAQFPPLYLAGAQVVQAVAYALFSIAALRMPGKLRKPAAVILLIAAGLWFTRFVIQRPGL